MNDARRLAIPAALVFAMSLLAWGLLSPVPKSPQRIASPSTLSVIAPAPMETVSPAMIAAARDNIQHKQRKLRDHGPKPFNKPQAAIDFYLDQRLSAFEPRIPWKRLQAEQEALRSREQSMSESGVGPGGIIGWNWIGPGNIGGRTRALIIDPNNPSVMYAAGVAGGIWKSTDAGASWIPADDFLLNLAVCSLAIDPTDSNVLYAGTGEGFYGSSSFVQGLGIFKSVDAGVTWTQLPGTVSGVPSGAFDYVNKIVVSPNNSNRVYAATRTGVWKSTDAGSTWTVKLSNPQYVNTPPTASASLVGCTDLVIRSDTAPDMLFATFGSFQNGGLYRTFNGGTSWDVYGVPANMGRTTIALAPSNNDIMYLLMADNGAGNPTGQLVNVFRSDDGGDTFTSQVDFSSLTGPWLLSNLTLATSCISGDTYSQGWYDNIIAVDPVDPDVVWVGGIDLFRSDDAGQNFEITGYWFFSNLVLPNSPNFLHADQHILVFHPEYDGTTNQTLYVGNDGGLFRTDNARAATSLEDCPLPADEPLPAIQWDILNNGYGVTQFYHGDSSPQVDLFMGGAQDNGSNLVTSLATPNQWSRVYGGDGGYIAIDPTNPDVLYAEIQFFPTFQKSIDGGQTFFEVINGITDDDGLFITPFAMDQDDPQTLWTGGSRPWRTRNGAASWELVGPNFVGADQISAIAIAPSRPQTVVLGFSNGSIARSDNARGPSPTWTVSNTGLPDGWISSVAIDPIDPDTVYCTFSTYGIPHVFRSTDGGNTWLSIDGIAFTGIPGIPEIPAHWIAVRPCNRNQLYVGTELGVFASDDRGVTWHPANHGLAHTVVECLDFQDDDTLVAFTHGRGAFVTELEPCEAPVSKDRERSWR